MEPIIPYESHLDHGTEFLHPQEVVLFLLTPGSKVRLHNGGSNAPINLSLGLTGSTGAFLEVAGKVWHRWVEWLEWLGEASNIIYTYAI